MEKPFRKLLDMGDCQAASVEEFWGKVKDVLNNGIKIKTLHLTAAGRK